MKPFVVCGLGFGDEGKGTITDFLARRHQLKLNVRYNGGAQAGHNVVTSDGRWHCFAQFGAATFNPGVETFLSREMVIEPSNLLAENEVLIAKGVTDALDRLIVDEEATLIAPYQKMIGRMKEVARGKNRFGSCGVGVGEAVRDRDRGMGITVRDIKNGTWTGKMAAIYEMRNEEAKKLLKDHPSAELEEIYNYFNDRSALNRFWESCRQLFRSGSVVRVVSAGGGSASGGKGDGVLRDMISNQQPMIFEGAQGALLDPEQGFAPHVTKTRSTQINAIRMIGEDKEIQRIGVMRAYGHRHGAGPFVTETDFMWNALHDTHNTENRWQGRFRTGWLDLVAIRYGLKINGKVDRLAITNLDMLSEVREEKVICANYKYSGDLKELDHCAVWEKLDKDSAKILELKIPSKEFVASGRFARMLERCRPLTYERFGGWRDDISSVRDFSALPWQAREYLNFIESSLGVPIGIVSVNPTADGKIVVSE